MFRIRSSSKLAQIFHQHIIMYILLHLFVPFIPPWCNGISVCILFQLNWLLPTYQSGVFHRSKIDWQTYEANCGIRCYKIIKSSVGKQTKLPNKLTKDDRVFFSDTISEYYLKFWIVLQKFGLIWDETFPSRFKSGQSIERTKLNGKMSVQFKEIMCFVYAFSEIKIQLKLLMINA